MRAVCTIAAGLVGAALTAALAVDATPAAAFGTARQGVGVGIGSGTLANGLSIKAMTGPGAIQGVVGFWGGGGIRKRFGDPDGIAASVDFLYEMPSLARSPFFTLDWSFGLGAGLGVQEFRDRAALAGAGIAGLEFNFTGVPLDLTFELRPTLHILPDPDLHLVDFTAHLRLWF